MNVILFSSVETARAQSEDKIMQIRKVNEEETMWSNTGGVIVSFWCFLGDVSGRPRNHSAETLNAMYYIMALSF